MKIELARGVRDFSPPEKIVRQRITDRLREVFELYGYLPLETPLIERYEVLTAKFAGGEGSDVSKEIFTLKDQGGRKLGLRFDLTVPLARYVAMNPKIKMPFKRYAIDRTYRDGPIKLGRYREFWQCDVDVVGVKKMTADAEMLKVALSVFDKLELDAYIVVNNRKLLSGLLEQCDVPKSKEMKAIIAIDKLEKIGKQGVKKELQEIGIKDTDKIFDILDTKLEDIKADNELAKDGLEELKELLSYIDDKRVRFSPSLARGLAYYTGTVFEGFLNKSRITSSICGGGRYDNMIGLYMGSDRQVPAVGISFGLEPLTEYFKSKDDRQTVTKVFLIPINTFAQCQKMADKLREKGINSEVDVSGRGISKSLSYANSLQIPYTIMVGEDELKSEEFTLKDMKSGKQEKLTINKIIEKLK